MPLLATRALIGLVIGRAYDYSKTARGFHAWVSWLNADILFRYSEFVDLREKLLMTFPNSEGAMPPLPPKSALCKHPSLDGKIP